MSEETNTENTETPVSAIIAKWNELDRAIQAGEITLTDEQTAELEEHSTKIDEFEKKVRENTP